MCLRENKKCFFFDFFSGEQDQWRQTAEGASVVTVVVRTSAVVLKGSRRTTRARNLVRLTPVRPGSGQPYVSRRLPVCVNAIRRQQQQW